MSTAIDYIPENNTATLNYNEKDSKVFIYAKPSTVDKLDKRILFRSRLVLKPTTIVITPIEDIKQQFNGTVIHFKRNELTVLLEDITDPSKPNEEMVISLEEIEVEDRPLIQIGARFYLNIGYRYGPKYPRERFTKISFRRLPKWTEDELQEAEKLAKKYANFWATDETTSLSQRTTKRINNDYTKKW